MQRVAFGIIEKYGVIIVLSVSEVASVIDWRAFSGLNAHIVSPADTVGLKVIFIKALCGLHPSTEVVKIAPQVGYLPFVDFMEAWIIGRNESFRINIFTVVCKVLKTVRIKVLAVEETVKKDAASALYQELV